MSEFVGVSHGLVVSLNPVNTGSTTCLRFTSVMWPQTVLRNSWFQYRMFSLVESGSGPPRKNGRSYTTSASELATMKFATLRSSPAHCCRIVAGVLNHEP